MYCNIQIELFSKAWWCMPIVLATQKAEEGRLSAQEFETSLGNTVRPCLKKKKEKILIFSLANTLAPTKSNSLQFFRAQQPL